MKNVNMIPCFFRKLMWRFVAHKHICAAAAQGRGSFGRTVASAGRGQAGRREILERYLEGRNLTVQDFRQTAQVSNLHAIKTLAQHGCGITFLYEAAVREELAEGKLRVLPLEDFPLRHDFSFLWRRGSLFADRYREIFDFMQSVGNNAVPTKMSAGSTSYPQNRPEALTNAWGGGKV